MRVERFSTTCNSVLCRQPRDHPTHRNEIRIGAVSGVQFGAEPVQFGPRLPGGGVIQVEDPCKPSPTYNNQPLGPDRNLVLLTNVNLMLKIDNIEYNRENKSRKDWEFISLFEFVWLDSHRNKAKKKLYLLS